MGLSTPPRPLFNTAWQAGLARSAETAQIATILIYDPATSTSTYNPVTNKFESIPVTIYSGPARVQPIRSAAETSDGGGNDTTVQTIRVQLPIDATVGIDFRPRHRGKVTSSPLFTGLTKYVYTLREVADSSNPFERTLEFDVNQEAVQV